MRVTEKIDKQQWDDIAGNCAYATFFHTSDWARVLGQTYPCENISPGFTFDNGVRAVLPLMKYRPPKRGIGWDDYVSGITYVYGGPVADGYLTDEQMHSIFEYILSFSKNYRRILIRGNPFSPKYSTGLLTESEDNLHAIHLDLYATPDDLYDHYTTHTKRKIKRAIKNGITIKRDCGRDAVLRIHDIYRGLMNEWGDDTLTNYPKRFFANMYDLGSEAVRCWGAYLNGDLISGAITLEWNDICAMWQYYSERETSNLQGGRLLIYTMCSDALERGFRFFDLRQSGGIKGVERFKESLEGRMGHFPNWEKINPLLTTYHSVRTNLGKVKRKLLSQAESPAQ